MSQCDELPCILRNGPGVIFHITRFQDVTIVVFTLVFTGLLPLGRDLAFDLRGESRPDML